MATIQTINSWFETGDIPTQEQFQQTFSSFRHKDDLIPILDVSGLDLALQNKLGTNHTNDANAHNTVLAKLDASNLNYENTEAWRIALGVGDIPDNVALVDVGEPQEVFNKEQIQALYLAMADYVLGGKIRADKIESLGLTELITAAETTLATFAANSGNYVFEKNDFIAIPINVNYSLYLFKGGDKSVSANYLPTGLTNITISMVEGLQAALDLKLEKPTIDGSLYVKKTGATIEYKLISPQNNYLLFWNGEAFINSNAYYLNGKIGFGTTSPSEQIQLTGRLRAKAIVLEDTAETLPQQVTYNNKHAYLTDSTGTKKQLLEKTYEDYLNLWNTLSDSEKTAIKTAANGGWTTNTMSVAIVSPPVVSTDDKPTWISLKGANLNFNPASFSVKIVDVTGATVLATIDNAQVQLYTNGLDLTFWFNFKDLPLGNCKIKLWNGVADYLIPQPILIVDVLDLIPLGSLIWEVEEHTPNAGTIFASGNGVNYQPSSTNKPYAVDSSIVAAAKSAEICGIDQNFYIRGTFSFTGLSGSYYDVFVGVMNNSTILELVNSIVAYIKGSARAGSFDSYKITYSDNGGGSGSGSDTQLCEFIIQRNQGLFTVILNVNGVVIVHTKTGSTEAMALGFFVTNSNLSTSSSYLTITEGYKF